jgi:iron complex outermembrane receptor protein
MKRLLFLTLLCLSVFSISKTFAQYDIKGDIKEKETKVPVDRATVVLQNEHDSAYHPTAVTDKEGKFQFFNLPMGDYSLVATCIGFKKYRSLQIILDPKTGKNRVVFILLQKDDSSTLKAVVVRSQKQYMEQKLDRVVINVGAIISNAGANTFDVLSNTPGLLLDEDGGINLRGREGVKVYVDDKLIYLSGADLVSYLKSLPSSSIDKIELIPNPPASYNAEGSGGIINIRTKKLTSSGFNGNVSLNYSQGVYSKTNNTFDLNYRNNKWNVFGGVGYSDANNFFNSDRLRRYTYPDPSMNYDIKQHYYEKNNRKNTSYKAGADYSIDGKQSLGFVYNGYTTSYSEKGNYQNTFLDMSGKIDSVMNVVSSLSSRTVNNTLTAYYRHKSPNNGNEFRVDLDYLNYRFTQRQFSNSVTLLSDSTVSSEYNLISDNPFNASIYSAKADIVHELARGLKMQAGVQSIYSRRTGDGSYLNEVGDSVFQNQQLNNQFRYTENINAAYLNFLKDFSRFSVEAGLRLENTVADGKLSNESKTDSTFRQSYLNAFPTAFFSYKLDSNGTNLLTLSAGRRISRPNYQDLNPSVFFFDRYTSSSGNPLLKPSYSTNLELTLAYGKFFTLSLNYSRTKDIILVAYEQLDSAFLSKNVNIDKVQTFGMNASSSVKIADWWTANLYAEVYNTLYKGVVLSNDRIDNSVTTFRTNINNQFKFGNGWGGEISGFYKTNMIFGQAILRPGGQVQIALQKKVLNDKGTISLTARDAFKTWVVKRDVNIPNLSISYANTLDTHLLSLTFAYRFGKTNNRRVHESGIKEEQNRVSN